LKYIYEDYQPKSLVPHKLKKYNIAV